MSNKMPLLRKIIRFFEIDYNYLTLPIGQSNKFSDILKTNFSLVLNLIFNKRVITSIKLGKITLSYDTIFTTKTFLDTCSDFYIETFKLSILSKKPVIIDVGANVGQFMFAVKSFFPNAFVYSFEPDPYIFEHLEKNASQFKNTKTFCVALSARAGKDEFYRDTDFSVWSSLVKPGAGRSFSKIKVLKEKGDSLLGHIKKIDLLKVDVEGAELEVLHGMKETLKRSNFLLVEASLARESEDVGSTKLIRYILDSNFTLHSVGRIFQDGKGGTQGAVDLLFKNNHYDEK